MSGDLSPSEVASPHAEGHRLELVWEAVTTLIAVQLLIELALGLLEPTSKELGPALLIVQEGALHCEKIFASVSEIVSFLGQKWVLTSELLVFFVPRGGDYFRTVFRRIKWAAAFLLAGCFAVSVAGRMLEAKTGYVPGQMNARGYEVASGPVGLYRFSDGKLLCSLARGTWVKTLRIPTHASAFGPDDLVVRADTENCTGWDLPLSPVGVIKAADFGRLHKV